MLQCSQSTSDSKAQPFAPRHNSNHKAGQGIQHWDSSGRFEYSNNLKREQSQLYSLERGLGAMTNYHGLKYGVDLNEPFQGYCVGTILYKQLSISIQPTFSISRD